MEIKVYMEVKRNIENDIKNIKIIYYICQNI